MRTVPEHEYTTYPRRFNAYKWFKPLLVGLLFAVFYLILGLAVTLITKVLFGSSVASSGYDDMDFYSAAGVFYNAAAAFVFIPSLICAALIVRDRPVSSYWSSMGGWRWKVFLKTFVAAFVFLGIPTVVSHLIGGRTGDVKFTIGGFFILTLLAPFQGVAEELTYRGFLMQTVSSWFMLPAAGIIVQTLLFTAVHPYNFIGLMEIVVSGLLYAMVCVFTKGLEAPSALHIVNNMSEIYMAGLGFGMITAEQTVPSVVLNLFFKILFFLFILFADKKLRWFDEIKYDDVARFNVKTK